MSAITIGQGGGGGGGSGGIVATPRSDERSGPGWGARTWLHHNMPDPNAIYTPLTVYPGNPPEYTQTQPATADPRALLSNRRMWQFADGDPMTEVGQNLPMSFATMDESGDLDAGVRYHNRTVMKFTAGVTAKFRFVIGIPGTTFRAALVMAYRQVMSGTDDQVLLAVNQEDQRPLSETNDQNLDPSLIGTQVNYRRLALDVPWREYAADELWYAIWELESNQGGMTHAYCQAEYVVH